MCLIFPKLLPSLAIRQKQKSGQPIMYWRVTESFVWFNRGLLLQVSKI